MQAAEFPRYTRNEGLMAPDGSFPLHLRRTKPYGYSLFNLDAMAAIAQILCGAVYR